MFKQSLRAQLARALVMLLLTIAGVQRCEPLMDALAEQAMSSGCHSHDSYPSDRQHHEQHHAHHH
ncbi:hypothetical protein [Aliagarivorans marinus]|uniref:hypothetical protein n=1 Tax=Aliagarivorans marinus TaxID=561965 RepID=UPI00041FB66E|nr:hypothetical protein [Aliagarivorans marinus]